ncbi:MAG: PHP domain-containing protein [Candidatus Hodarchaeota archaeon]
MVNPLRHDLHIHSKYSDAYTSVEDIVKRASSLGLERIAVVDHFWPSLGSSRAGHELILRRRAEIADMREAHPDLEILDGAEVDIQSNGELAPVAGGLEQFDIVIGSVHWGSDSTRWASAVSKAVRKSSFDILGHWDGYLSSYREEDGWIIAKALAEKEITIELNKRYGTVYEEFFVLARGEGCMFSLGSDSHHISEVGQLKDQIQLVKALELPLKVF